MQRLLSWTSAPGRRMRAVLIRTTAGEVCHPVHPTKKRAETPWLSFWYGGSPEGSFCWTAKFAPLACKEISFPQASPSGIIWLLQQLQLIALRRLFLLLDTVQRVTFARDG